MKEFKCKHPDHVDGTSCEERSIGCSPNCSCCMGELAVELTSIYVFHQSEREYRFSEIKDKNNGKFQLVAVIELSSELTIDSMLSKSFRYTQSLESHWSENSNVTAIGNINELRSTSVGDMVMINNEFYAVDSYGFRKI